jgi:threonine dehydrogenase-like Zn-dependent dehydrogenase
MRALCWHGKEDIRYDTVPDPKIEDSRDAIIKVTSCASVVQTFISWVASCPRCTLAM